MYVYSYVRLPYKVFNFCVSTHSLWAVARHRVTRAALANARGSRGATLGTRPPQRSSLAVVRLDTALVLIATLMGHSRHARRAKSVVLSTATNDVLWARVKPADNKCYCWTCTSTRISWISRSSNAVVTVHLQIMRLSVWHWLDLLL